MPASYLGYEEKYTPQQVYKFTTIPCRWCKGEPIVITVPAQELHDYNQGIKHIQDALPSLTAGERERLFMTGYCEACIDAMGKEEED